MGISARAAGRVLLTPVWLVVVALLAIALARVVAFDRVRVLLLADSYTFWIYLPAYPIAIAAAFFRARLLAVAAAVLIVAHLFWIVPPMLHTVAIPAAAREAPRLRIVSANLRFDNTDHAPVLAEISRDDADIIVLEEVTFSWWRSIQASGLLATHPDHVDVPRYDSGGMAILSRDPLSDIVVRRADGWPIITASIRVHGRTIHLAGIHLVAPLVTFDFNQRQQRAITSIVRSLPRPRLIAGDFNVSPYNRWYGTLRGLGLREAAEAVGRPFSTTWPNGRHFLPTLRLDHVFVDPTITPLHVAEGTGTGSDHRPIIVDLALYPLLGAAPAK